MFANQTKMQLNHLYEVHFNTPFNGLNMFYPVLYVNTGKVDVYASNSTTQPTSTVDMTLDDSATELSGYNMLNTIPKYFCVVQNDGTTTDLVFDGLELEDLGIIS